jgi:hypothetical protein
VELYLCSPINIKATELRNLANSGQVWMEKSSQKSSIRNTGKEKKITVKE